MKILHFHYVDAHLPEWYENWFKSNDFSIKVWKNFFTWDEFVQEPLEMYF